MRESKNAAGVVIWLVVLAVMSAGAFGEPNSAAPAPSAGRTYYLQPSPEGNDTYPGTKEKPWATVEEAAGRLKPGDTLLIRAGTYRPERRVVVSGANPGGREISVAGYPGELPVLDFGKQQLPLVPVIKRVAGGQGALMVLETSHVRISNLKVANVSGAGIMSHSSSYVTIENCRTYDTRSSGICAWISDHITIANNDLELAGNGGGQECLSIASVDTFEVHDNKVHSLRPDGTRGGREGIDVKEASRKGKVYRNEVYDLARLGIYVDGWYSNLSDIEVFDNRIYRCAYGVCVGAEGGTMVERIRVHNNLLYDNNGTGICVWEWDGGSRGPRRDIYIYNNTVYGNGTAGGKVSGGIHITAKDINNLYVFNNIFCKNSHYEMATLDQDMKTHNLVFEHNLIDSRKSVPEGSPHRVVYGENLVVAEPMFVDAEKRDFRLRKGSPAVDAGKPGKEYNDADGSRADIGAIPSTASGDRPQETGIAK